MSFSENVTNQLLPEGVCPMSRDKEGNPVVQTLVVVDAFCNLVEFSEDGFLFFFP
jgi:hypothetical protein